MQTPAFAATKTVRMWKLFRGLMWVVAVVVAFLCPTHAFGQTNSTWNGGTGNWSNATDWSPNQVPNNGGGNTYNVTIDSGGVDTVTLDQSASINSLVLGGLVQPTLLQDLAGSPDTLSISGQLTVSQAATLQFSNGSSVTVGGNLSNDGRIVLSNGSTLTVTGTLGNYNAIQSLQLNGAGTVLNAGSLVNDSVIIIGNGATLNLTNQPQGITEISGRFMGVFGTVKAGSANGFANLGEIDLEAYFVLGNGQTTTTTPGSGTLGIGFLALLGMTNSASGAGTTLIVKGNLSNSGMLETDFSSTDTKRNTLTVTGTFTNTNDSTAGIGSLDVMNVGSLANNGSLAIGGTLNLTGQPDGGTLVNEGSLLIGHGGALKLTNGGGSFIQTSGQTVVDGTLNSVPAVQIKGGTLSGSGIINANVIMGGKLSPGNSPGILTINGNYTQTAFGAYVAELEGLTAGTGYDQVDVNGTADLAGTLDVNSLNGFTVALGDSFILMKYDSETGTYSMVDLPELNTGLKWDLSYDPGYLDLSVTSGVTTTPEPSTYLLWSTAGLLGIGIWVRRKFGRGLKSSV
jgi:fibronectin-binding autotransporter adhesin